MGWVLLVNLHRGTFFFCFFQVQTLANFIDVLFEVVTQELETRRTASCRGFHRTNLCEICEMEFVSSYASTDMECYEIQRKSMTVCFNFFAANSWHLTASFANIHTSERGFNVECKE